MSKRSNTIPNHLLKRFRKQGGFSLVEVLVSFGLLMCGVMILLQTMNNKYLTDKMITLSAASLDINPGIKALLTSRTKLFLREQCTSHGTNYSSLSSYLINEQLGAMGTLAHQERFTPPPGFEKLSHDKYKDYWNALKRCNTGNDSLLANSNLSADHGCLAVAMSNNYINMIPNNSIVHTSSGLVEMNIRFINLGSLAPSSCKDLSIKNASAGIRLSYILHWIKRIDDNHFQYNRAADLLYMVPE